MHMCSWSIVADIDARSEGLEHLCPVSNSRKVVEDSALAGYASTMTYACGQLRWNCICLPTLIAVCADHCSWN